MAAIYSLKAIYFGNGNKMARNWVYSYLEKINMQGESRRARFEACTLPHIQAAYNLARWLARSDGDAEDIVQEAYLRAFRFFDGFHGDDARTWLLAIVRNTTYTWLKQNRAHNMSVAFDEEFHSLDAADVAGWINSPDNNPQAVLTRNADALQLNRALELLPLEFREVVILRELEEMSYKQIAHIADIPVGTVMSRLARGRKLLSESLRQMNKEACNGL